MDWVKAKLEEIAEEKRENYEPTVSEKLNYIGLEHIEQQTLRLNAVGKSNETISSKKKFNAGDILFGSLRPYFRKVYKPKFNGVCSTDITVIQSKKNFSQDYLFYLIANQPFIDYATNYSNGTRMPRANWKVISKSEWSVPKENKDQQKIASILSSYDELIENNTSRIKILEEMAQAIYKEWFVNFRFPAAAGRPGHEKVKFVDSPLGKIPEGWEVVELNTFGYIITGKTPSTKIDAYFGDEIPFIKTPDMHSNIFIIKTNQYLSKEGADSQEKKYLPPNSICISCIGTVGVVSITSELSQTNQQINSIILNNQNNLEYLYFTCVSLKETLVAYGINGATMANVNKEKFSAMKVLKPKQNFLDEYQKTVNQMFEEIKNLLFKNQNLRKTRNLLLPKLMSGEVEI